MNLYSMRDYKSTENKTPPLRLPKRKKEKILDLKLIMPEHNKNNKLER